jgi:hypothetical protein
MSATNRVALPHPAPVSTCVLVALQSSLTARRVCCYHMLLWWIKSLITVGCQGRPFLMRSPSGSRWFDVWRVCWDFPEFHAVCLGPSPSVGLGMLSTLLVARVRAGVGVLELVCRCA